MALKLAFACLNCLAWNIVNSSYTRDFVSPKLALNYVYERAECGSPLLYIKKEVRVYWAETAEMRKLQLPLTDPTLPYLL
jgi:hypothetical protein